MLYPCHIKRVVIWVVKRPRVLAQADKANLVNAKKNLQINRDQILFQKKKGAGDFPAPKKWKLLGQGKVNARIKTRGSPSLGFKMDKDIEIKIDMRAATEMPQTILLYGMDSLSPVFSVQSNNYCHLDFSRYTCVYVGLAKMGTTLFI